MLFIRVVTASVGAALLLSATQSVRATETPLERAVATGAHPFATATFGAMDAPARAATMTAARHWAKSETDNCPACSMPPPYRWLASCLSVAKLPYRDPQDGISYTVSVAAQQAHLSEEELIAAAAKAIDMDFDQGGFHMNLNVIDEKTLQDAMEHPDKYPQLTIRVSGYAVNFVRLTREQQEDVISRTFHSQV